MNIIAANHYQHGMKIKFFSPLHKLKVFALSSHPVLTGPQPKKGMFLSMLTFPNQDKKLKDASIDMNTYI